MIFDIFNYLLLIILGLLSFLPILHILAISLSSKTAAMNGDVLLWPIGFNLDAYRFVINSNQFMNSFWVSVKRVILGVPINVLITVLCAYPLSKEPKDFQGRGIYVWILIITMFFSGGLIPTYLTVKATGLIDTIWALIIPIAVPSWSIIMLKNFFKVIPKELEEAALIDGLGHTRILFQIFIPLSLPAIATITLFSFVNHWNSWFDGLIYMNDVNKYPLQSYLKTVIVNIVDVNQMAKNPEQWKIVQNITERTMKSAQIFIATLPVMLIYPFLQRYFIKGLVIGAVKG